MCILPNFAAQDLEEFRRDRKKETRTAKSETVEIIVPEKQILKNSV